ncbi:hypothetical protein [Opitutus sp. GAS368]|uniref:hypothetical protein n=1 Tax=Opitutus sp. GAS368 TaxID=1882749 RepID=UPI00087A0F29|nr:hypothetical protein [Opitutus sp. GAS368]SDR70889.1 hypothetical protein SAMN05444173_0528 [Opitutus sp. GAS368]
MPTKYNPAVVLIDANKIIDTWSANADFKLGTVTLESFTAARDKVAAADATVESKRTELSGLMNDRDDSAAVLHDLVTRARSGFRAAYGPNSSQYEQSGGTRNSERKVASRRAKPAAGS